MHFSFQTWQTLSLCLYGSLKNKLQYLPGPGYCKEYVTTVEGHVALELV